MELCSLIQLLKGTPSAHVWAEQRPPLLKPLCKRWWVDETAPCVSFTVFCENNDLRVSVGLLECTECFLFLSPCVVFLIIIVFDTILTLYMCFCLYKIFEWMQNTFVIFSWILYMNYSINVENRFMCVVAVCSSTSDAAFPGTTQMCGYLLWPFFKQEVTSFSCVWAASQWQLVPSDPAQDFKYWPCTCENTQRQKQRRARTAFGGLKDTSALGVLPHPGYLLSLQLRQLLIQPNDRWWWRRPYIIIYIYIILLYYIKLQQRCCMSIKDLKKGVFEWFSNV